MAEAQHDESNNNNNNPGEATNNELDLTLYQYPAAWGLPSGDADCLAASTLLRVCSLPYKVVEWCYPEASPSGELPFLVVKRKNQHKQEKTKDLSKLYRVQRFWLWIDEKLTHQKSRAPEPEIIAGLNNIIDFVLGLPQGAFLRAQYDYPENKLEQRSVLALFDRLKQASQISWWLEEVNYPACKSLFASQEWPLNWILPRKKRDSVQKILKSPFVPRFSYKESKNIITMLAQRLDTQSFYFGEFLSVIDCVIYARLAVELKAPLPDPRLGLEITMHHNLIDFCNRFFYSFISPASISHFSAVEDKATIKNVDRTGLRNNIGFLLCSAGAALFYISYNQGLLTISPRQQ